MALPEDATSEWVTSDGLRYAASPEDVERAVEGGVDFAVHNDATSVDAGCCTQVLLHKARNGAYTLLLNGRASKPGADGMHTLPPFREDQLIREDATGRKVPAPVVVSVLVEKGGCAPDSVHLQVLQRKFVRGVQVDEGRETVAMEERLKPMHPGDAENQAAIVAYPMLIGPSPKLVLQDFNKARKASEKNRIGWINAFFKAKNFWNPIRGVSDLVFQNVRSAVWRSGISTAALISGFATAISMIFTNEAGQYLAAAVSIYGAIEVLHTQLQVKPNQTDEELQEDPDQQNSTKIPLFEFPALLRRVTGLQSGGGRSKDGQSLSLDALRKAGRGDDASMLTWLMFAQVLNNDEFENSIKATEDALTLEQTIELREELKLPNSAPTPDLPAERVQKVERGTKLFREVLEEGMKRQLGIRDNYKITGLEESDVLKGSYIETILRLEVVDARRSVQTVREEFTMRGAQPMQAGLAASGYRKLYDDIDKVSKRSRKSLRDFSDMACDSPLFAGILEMAPKEKTKVSIRRTLVGFLASTSRKAYLPTMTLIAESIESMTSKMLDGLNNFTKTQVLTTPAQPSTCRYLPHVVRFHNRSGLSLVLDRDDESVDIASSVDILADSAADLRDAVLLSSATMRVLRQSIAQFIESDGILRPRMQLQLLMKSRSNNLAFELPEFRKLPARDEGVARSIGTRNVYAPRMPLEVVESMACRASHPRMDEAVAIGWLVAGADASDQVGVAMSFGLPPSHLGELVLGVVADLATDDALDRALKVTHRSPSRAQAMASSVHLAIDRLMLAHALAGAVLRQQGSVQVRLREHDAVFECYPEGDTLRKLLHESAVWRSWLPADHSSVSCTTSAAGGDARVASAMATPTSLDPLRQLLKAIGTLRHSKARLSTLPFLPPQTLAHHTDEWLALVSTAAADSAIAQGEAWAALGMQVRHAYAAAQRIHVLATGLGLQDHAQSALLCECALARPVLHLVPPNSPELYPEALWAFTQPIAPRAGGSLVQNGVPTTPRADTLLADTPKAREWLSARLASMRLDLYECQHERVLEGPDAKLAKDFARMRFEQPFQYLVPFGYTVGEGRTLLMTPFFEDAPVYIGLFHQRVASATELDVVQVRARSAHDERDDLHPYVITRKENDMSAAMVHIPPVVWSNSLTEIPKTLSELTQAMLDKTHVCGAGVDAAAAFVFNVERLVQCALVVGKPAVLHARPPKAPKAKHSFIPDRPSPPPTMRRAQHRFWALTIAADVHRDNHGSRKWLIENLKVDPETCDVELFGETAEWTQGQVLDLLEFPDVEDPNGDLHSAMQARYDVAKRAITKIDTRGEAFVNEHNNFASIMDAEVNRHNEAVKRHTDRWEAENRGNLNRTEEARKEGEGALFLWPAVVAVANAIVLSMMKAPPTIMVAASEDKMLFLNKGVEVFRGATAKWETDGLAAVPLSEMAAVVVGMRDTSVDTQ